MNSYILKRLLLIIPTLLGIMTINFFIVQIAPGGPVEQAIAQYQGIEGGNSSRIASGTNSEIKSTSGDSQYRGAQGVDPEYIAALEKLYGFDKPIVERYFSMLWRYAKFDFGDSFYRNEKVTQLIIDKMPVSISLGLWTTLLAYLISIPLGIKKATSHGSRFDIWTSTIVTVAYAVPAFIIAIMLIVLFAGGSYYDWFPLRGLVSDNFDSLSLWGQIKDYFWHLALPISASVLASFATLTMLTKNSFLDEIHKQYVITARAKGCSQNRILYGHIFRNAMLLVLAGLPAALIGIFFTGSMLIEVIFSLDGLGLLSFESVINRDYPVIFASLYIFTLVGLVLKLISDVTYTLIDPRITFEGR
ncbi:ABC transporter permease [Psychromonas marina]|uniref:ABC transporter permease n=1 Tax=Psychromonas marina TaxID=88364 RepID=A0ABQ6E4R9_9GAMM|nr:microcin C ABC transporter permease YejB [Psychromonas marina]GLS92320.1 ABC transporter permease [Psychromonas marina]